MNDRAGERASAPTSGASARAPERSGGSPGLLSESQIARAPGLSRDAFNAKMDNQLSIAERRWLASRFAWRASAYLAEARPSFEGLLSALSVSREALSEDALIAVRALIRESSLDPRSASLVPGFRGPDAWYAERGDEPAAER